jgi:predicted Fe-Mo cluster-binding NifX family protein
MHRGQGVTIGVPILKKRISPVLDTATHLLLVTRRRGREVRRRECSLEVLSPEDLARSLAGMGIQVLLCAALSESLQRALEQEGVRVRSHVCGDVESVLQAFCSRQLGRAEFRMPGCRGHHVGGRCQQHMIRSRRAAGEPDQQQPRAA